MREHLEGFRKFIRIMKGLAESSVKLYSQRIEEFCVWLEGQGITELAAISRKDIEKYMERCFYRGNSNQTRTTKLIALRNFFRYLSYEGIISRDLTVDIPRPKVWRKFVQKFSREDILKMFRTIDITAEMGIRNACVLILGAFCGLRAGEIVRLNLNDLVIDERGWAEINIIDTKHHGNRSVYLWKVPSVVLQQYFFLRLSQEAKGSDPYLITYKKGGYPKFNRLTNCVVEDIVRKLADDAGLRKAEIKPHMLRATHINDLRQIKGYDLPAIAERVGHQQIATTDRYIPRRERIHKEYRSLHEYWKDFGSLWGAHNYGDSGDEQKS